MLRPCGDMWYAVCVSLSSCGFRGESQWFGEVCKEALTAKLDRGEWKQV